MRMNARTCFAALAFAFLSSAPIVITSTTTVYAQNEEAQPVQQIALTDKQITGVIAASKELDALMAKLPQDDNQQQPDPKVTAQLDAVVKKHGFASYADYQAVIDNITLVLNGFDPSSKKYIGAEAAIKMQITEVQGDKTMSQKDKKDAMDQLNAELKAAEPVKFPGNITLVTKYYDKLGEALQEGQQQQQ
jgi:hypothetical protein